MCPETRKMTWSTCGRQLGTLVLVILLTNTATSTIDVDEEQCMPEQVHLSYGNTLSEMVVMWATPSNCTTALVYGDKEWGFHNTANGRSVKFDVQNPNGIQYLHQVKLQNLQAETTYHYSPLSNNIGAGPFYFKTPPAGQDWSPMFLVYGDLGIHSYTIPSLTDEALSGEYTAVLHDGGLKPWFLSTTCMIMGKTVGDSFMRLIQGISSQLPYMTSVGNHEINEDTFAHYRHRFSMPGSDWPIPLDKMWYSIDVGPVHLISYSTEVFFTLDKKYVNTQHDWLLKDLKQANENRAKCPWVVAYGHRPMYCSNDDNDDCTKPDSLVRAGLEDIFYHFGVDIVIQAHEHSYERLWPHYKGVVIANNYTNPGAPVQLITGAAGSKHGLDLMANRTDDPWSAFRRDNGSLNSYGRLEIVNSTHALWEQKSAMDHDLMDSIWIVQENHGPFKTEELPANLTKEIEETIEATGGKPTFSETETVDTNSAIVEDDNKQRMAIGIAFGCLVAVVLIVVIAVKKCRRKRKAVRRWEQMDFNYGKKFYSPAKDLDKELDNDFEIDMSDGTLPTTKLLSDD
ncbi:acid phosphatase type 7-like [Haliotis rubra]|uniref:acid phosphatase type 7-like n=1 Tax=Haliotis rubra TaxID=36100 RepID=UPI001EE537E8|nr:acid phosphatase type 7-like [Haliotis rubra]